MYKIEQLDNEINTLKCSIQQELKSNILDDISQDITQLEVQHKGKSNYLCLPCLIMI